MYLLDLIYVCIYLYVCINICFTYRWQLFDQNLMFYKYKYLRTENKFQS